MALDNLSMSTVGPLFERLCRDLQQPVPLTEDAINIVITAALRDIVQESTTPEEGLQRLMDDVYWPHVSGKPVVRYAGDSHGLEQLVGAYWSYDELRSRPTELSIDGLFGEDAIPNLDEHVRQCAKEWLTAHSA